jgi:4-amino-4-deoxy-L-arabinose transferase-like glycosyltransferase
VAARLTLAGVFLFSVALYFHSLGDAPVYLGWDEARFAVQAHAIATTGRDMAGTRTPLFFYNFDPLIPNQATNVWWQPFLIYLTAAVMRVTAISEWSTRAPVVGLALLDILLIAAVAREMFGSRWHGVLAAFLLALAPAHFLFGRQEMDYFCPLPFALAWLWCLVRYLRTERTWLAVAAGGVLGLGLYSYIASWMVMPFYLVLTALVFLVIGTPRAIPWLAAGFTAPLLLMIPWTVSHPSMMRELLQGYGVTAQARLAERVRLYWDYFNPSFLFFSGGSEWMWATRRAGVFAMACAVLLPCGLWHLCRRRLSVAGAIAVIGFFFAPVPIIIALPEAPAYATARDLLVLPFGILVSVAGVEWLVREHRAMGSAIAALLILSVPLQFRPFARDYFGDYQARSAFRFDAMNLRETAEYVIGSDAVARVPAIFLGQQLQPGESVQWKFHLLKADRPDLWERTRYFTAASFDSMDIPPGSLLVLDAANPSVNQLIGESRCALVHVVKDVGGMPASAVLRRN